MTNQTKLLIKAIRSPQEVAEILIRQIDCDPNPNEYMRVLRGNLTKIIEGRD